MNKMNMVEMEFAKFSTPQRDLIDKGVDLYNQYLYEKRNETRFSYLANIADESGKVLTYNEKNKAFVNAWMDMSYSATGLNKEMFSLEQAMDMTHFRQIAFSILTMVVDKTRPVVDLQQAMLFADIRNMAEGDSLTIQIPSKHLMTVNTVANGKRTSLIQEVNSSEFTLSPQAKVGTVAVDLYKLLSGVQDLGCFIDVLNRSFEAKMYQEIVDIMFGAYTTLGTNWKEATYAEDTFIKLCQRVEMANGAEPVVYGTKLALKKLVPGNDYFKMGQGGEYFKNGYLASPWGYSAVMLNQTYKIGSDFDFSTPNDKVLVLSTGVDKPVKIGMEGRTLIDEDRKTADEKYVYTFKRRWDIQIITQSNYGIITV